MAEHVSFFRGKALPGKRQAVIDQMAKWEREQKSKAKGFLGSVMAFGNDDTEAFMGTVRWDNTENYFANSSRPEQDAWYQEMRAHLAGDMEWFDGTLARETRA